MLWMHLAVRRMERRQVPQIRQLPQLPEMEGMDLNRSAPAAPERAPVPARAPIYPVILPAE
jgi:hypothetical protein